MAAPNQQLGTFRLINHYRNGLVGQFSDDDQGSRQLKAALYQELRTLNPDDFQLLDEAVLQVDYVDRYGEEHGTVFSVTWFDLVQTEAPLSLDDDDSDDEVYVPRPLSFSADCADQIEIVFTTIQ